MGVYRSDKKTEDLKLMKILSLEGRFHNYTVPTTWKDTSKENVLSGLKKIVFDQKLIVTFCLLFEDTFHDLLKELHNYHIILDNLQQIDHSVILQIQFFACGFEINFSFFVFLSLHLKKVIILRK